MGIDILDVIFRVEKSLGIRIERGDFNFSPEGGKFLVRDFYDIVERKVAQESQEILDSPNYREKTFNEIKQAFAEGFGLSENEHWTKETTIRELYVQIPETERKKTWSNFLQQQPLSRTNSNIWSVIDKENKSNCCLTCAGYIFFVIGLLSIYILGQFLFQTDLLVFLFIIFLCTGTILWLFLFNSYPKEVPKKTLLELSLGKITDRIVLHRKNSLKNDGTSYTREEIEEVVKAALCEALAVKPEEVVPEADLIRDLGMG